MAHPMGERESGGLRLDFDRRLKLEFHGSKVTSDAGLLPFRELDDALGLTEIAGDRLVDPRTGKNGQHGMVGLFRQSTFGRLGGYEDVNDADRLGHDPAMRWIVGGGAVTKQAASASQMGRFETEFLAADDNLAALADLSGLWIDRVHDRRPPKASGSRPGFERQPDLWRPGGHGLQRPFRLHLLPSPVSVQPVRRPGAMSLRRGNVHSACDWRDVLVPVVERYKEREVRLYFRGDAAFASPDAIRHPPARQQGSPGEHRSPANPPRRSPAQPCPPLLRQLQLSGRIVGPQAPRGRQGRVASGRALSPRRLHRHQPEASRRARRGVLQPARHGGTVDQGRQERRQVDAAVVPQVQPQRRPAPASCAGLQSRQLHADPGVAEGGGALVADHHQGEAGQDRRQGRRSWPLRHVPDGRGCGARSGSWRAIAEVGMARRPAELRPVSFRSPTAGT
jgi:hypothetical protein